MTRWEIKVYAFNHGHLYTMYSDATLESAKDNMMRRFRESKNHAHKTALIVIRDLKEEHIVYTRKISSLGVPRTRWEKINYCPYYFSDKNAWDKKMHEYLKNRSYFKQGDF